MPTSLSELTFEDIEFIVSISLTVLMTFALLVAVKRLFDRLFHGKFPKIALVVQVIILPALILFGNDMARSILDVGEGSYRATQIDAATLSLLWIVGAWLLNQAISIFIWNEAFEKYTNSPAPQFLRGLVTLMIYILAVQGVITFVAGQTNTGLIFSATILAGVVGLALQNVLSDIFSGLSITVDRPYRIGDWIELDNGTIGQVVDFTWRSTRLLSRNNSIYVIPNSVTMRSIIHNYDLPNSSYSTWFTISIDAEVEPLYVRQLMMNAVLKTSKVLKHPPPVVRFSDMSTQPYKYLIWAYFENYMAQFAGKEELFSNIWAELHRAGISAAAVKFDIATRDAQVTSTQWPAILDELGNTEVFKTLTDDDLQGLAEVCGRKLYQSGQTIISEGDEEKRSLLILTSGMVLVQKTDALGALVEIERLGVGQFFGETAVLTGQPHAMTISTLTACELIEVPSSALEPLLSQNEALRETLTTTMEARQAHIKAEMDKHKAANRVTWPWLSRAR